jgi:hypothetical protein
MEKVMTAASTRSYNPIAGSASVPPTYAADLDVLASMAKAVCDDARQLVAGLNDAQFNWKPTPHRWSIAQCLKHLVLTGTMAANEQEATIAQLRQKNKRSDGPYAYRGIPAKMGSMLMGGVEPPVKKKFKTAKKVVPASHHERDALLKEFLAVYGRLGQLVTEAKGLDLGAGRVGLPVPFFSIRLGQSIPFEIAHARRHLWQAHQVRDDPSFPTV